MFKKTKLFELLKNEHQLTPKKTHSKLKFYRCGKRIIIFTHIGKDSIGKFHR